MSLISIPLLSSHLRLGLPIRFFNSGFPTKILYVFIIFPMLSTRPAHPTLLNFVILLFR